MPLRLILPQLARPLALALMAGCGLLPAAAAQAQQAATIETTAKLSAARELGAIAPVQEVRFGEVAIPRNLTAQSELCVYTANAAESPQAGSGQSALSLGCERFSAPAMGQMKVNCSSTEFSITSTSSTATPGAGIDMALDANTSSAVFVEGTGLPVNLLPNRRFKCSTGTIIQLNPVLFVTDAAKPTGSVLKVGTVTVNVAFF